MISIEMNAFGQVPIVYHHYLDFVIEILSIFNVSLTLFGENSLSVFWIRLGFRDNNYRAEMVSFMSKRLILLKL